MGIIERLKNLFGKDEENNYVARCKRCGEIFDAMKQVGDCPHPSIHEFIYGKKVFTARAKD